MGGVTGYAGWVLLLLAAALAQPADDAAVTTRAFVFMVGGTAGVYDIAPDTGHHYLMTLSPASSGTWEFGSAPLRLAVTACVTPTYVYAPARSLTFPSFIETRLGFVADLGGVRAGADLWVGLISAGVGAHVGGFPWTGKRGVRHGFDVRFDMLAGQYPHTRVMAQYAWTPWPRFSR